MKSSANLSFLWTFVAFVGGVALLGLPGVIVGPLAFSLFIAYLRAMEILPGAEKPSRGLPLTASGTVDSVVPDSIPSGEYTAVTTPPPERLPVPALLLPPAPGGKNRNKKKRR
jgi:hypothetical protein